MTTHTDDESRTVEIPERTARTISERLHRTEFDSVDDYVLFALGQVVRELDRQSDDQSTDSDPDDGPAQDESPADTDEAADEAVADRLESLGYL